MVATDQEPLILPWDAVKSRYTSNDYLRKSRYFLEYAGLLDSRLMHHKRGPGFSVERERHKITRAMTSFISRSTQEPKWAKGLVISFIQAEKGRIAKGEIGAEHLRGCLKPVKLACELNDIPIAWKNVLRLIPGGRRGGPDREYTLEEVRAILAAASLHLKVAILFMASSGMRVGAFDYMNVGDVNPLTLNDNLVGGIVKVYNGEGDDEYETLISKEAYNIFQDYLSARRGSGEKVDANSPAIVIRSGRSRCASPTIKNSLNVILWKVGIRKEKKRRHEFQINHGLRKFFDNVAKDHVDESFVERLIGHSGGVKEHYDRHLPKPLVAQYLNAMPYLSIDPAYRAEAELTQKLEKAEETHGKEFTELRLKLLERESESRELREKVRHQDGVLKEVMAMMKEMKEERERELLSRKTGHP